MSIVALERRLRMSAVLVMVGLLVEIASLTWRHPTAFILFFVVGGAFMAAGILGFLYSIVSKGGSDALDDVGAVGAVAGGGGAESAN
jgi:hypothetical protein